MARNLRPGADWVPAVVVERLGPLTYLVETSDRLLWKRHIDLLREFHVRSASDLPALESNVEDFPDVDPLPNLPAAVPAVEPTGRDPRTEDPPADNTGDDPGTPDAAPTAPGAAAGTSTGNDTEPVETPPTERRYPTRVRHAPDRFE